MEPQLPTQIIADWLTNDTDEARRLRGFYANYGIDGFRAETQAYLQNHASDSDVTKALVQWAMEHNDMGPQPRDNVLDWAFSRVDWSGLARQFGGGESTKGE